MKTKLIMILAAVGILSSCSRPQYGYFNNQGSSSAHAYKAKAVEAPSTEEDGTVEVAIEVNAEEVYASAAPASAPMAANKGLKRTAQAIEKVAAGETLTIKEQAQAAVEVKREIKKAEKQLKAEGAINDETPVAGKSQVIALVIAIAIGVMGIHRFYLGYPLQGVLMLLTGGGCGVWWLIDVIRIITGDLKPKGGDYTDKL